MTVGVPRTRRPIPSTSLWNVAGFANAFLHLPSPLAQNEKRKRKWKRKTTLSHLQRADSPRAFLSTRTLTVVAPLSLSPSLSPLALPKMTPRIETQTRDGGDPPLLTITSSYGKVKVRLSTRDRISCCRLARRGLYCQYLLHTERTV